MVYTINFSEKRRDKQRSQLNIDRSDKVTPLDIAIVIIEVWNFD